MGVPKTYIMIPPAGVGVDDAFGQGIPFKDIVAGLQRINPRITAWEPTRIWYPGAERAEGVTCLWLGPPSEPRSVKITGIGFGVVPEFTQLYPAGHSKAGEIERKGWRAIFDRVIKAQVATKEQIERQFRVTLDISPEPDTNCRLCARQGIRNRATSPGGVCLAHEHLDKLRRR